MLLYQADPQVREIFNQITDTGTSANYDTAKAKLKAHFDPPKNKRYEVYRFRQATQESDETTNSTRGSGRTMAETREFTDILFEIEEQIILGGRSSKNANRLYAIQRFTVEWSQKIFSFKLLLGLSILSP